VVVRGSRPVGAAALGCPRLSKMLPVLQYRAATAHDFALAFDDVMAVFGSEASRTCRRFHWRNSRRCCSSLQMLLGTRRCSVGSLGVRVEVVILFSSLAGAAIMSLIRRTVGVLQLVFWLHTHVFFGTLESGVVQSDSIM
jgi:hypothetical protein